MTHKIRLILLFMTTTLAMQAQSKFDPAKFRAELHRHIMVEARLTQAEADKFFPLFDELKTKQRAIHRKMRELTKVPPTTDAACKSVILKHDNMEIEMKQLERTYHEKFQKVLPSSKVYAVLRAERGFHKATLQKAAKRHH